MAFTDRNLTENTEAQRELQGITHKLSRLLEISVTLNSTLEQDKLLNFILETAADVLECEGASIMLYDEKKGELVFAAATASDPKKLAKIPVPLEGSIAGTIFRQNKPLVINNVAEDPRHFSLVGKQVKFQPRSLVGVPMRIRDKTTGVLEALNKRDGRFTQKDAQYLFIIASQAAVAMHNAQLLRALKEAYDEVSQLDNQKSNFMAIASHELRTPLGLILGYASFLQEQAEGELSRYASLILNSALRMQSLVEDMTNMNLLKSGGTELELIPIPIQGPIQEAYEGVATIAEAKSQQISLLMPPDPLYVNADQEKLTLVFINLLNNAIHYTPDGGSVQVQVTPLHDEVRIEIRDTGYGIPPGELENIFKEFYQVEDHMTRKYGGLGLGLAIARGQVEQHGGRIWAESEGLGKGSTFKIVLPQAR